MTSRDSRSTWVSVQCPHCRHAYMVQNDAPVEMRHCPLCRQRRETRRIPGFRIRALLEAAGGTPPDPSPSPSG